MSDKPKHPGGRPSKYSPAYCDEVVDILSQGHSLTGFAGHIGVTRETVWAWTKEHPEFANAVKAGQAKAVVWWEKRLADIVENGGGNVVAAIFGLKNRAADDWRDKQMIEHSVDGALADVLEAARKRKDAGAQS